MITIIRKFSSTNKLYHETTISKAEKTIINEFSKRDDLVFAKVDKGEATVILDVKNYRRSKQWKKLNHDLAQEHTKNNNDTIETFQWQQLLQKSICDNLKTRKVRKPHFYITPKVNKKDIPGRSNVSSIDCHTSKIPKFIDQYLQPYAKTLPPYDQDTTVFINKLETVKINEKTPS